MIGFLGPPINTIELLCLPGVELGWAKQNSLGSWEEAPSGKELVAVVVFLDPEKSCVGRGRGGRQVEREPLQSWC